MAIEQQGTDIFVCHRLREERERLGLGQQEVARAAEVSVKTVGRWEKESAIPSKKLNALLAVGFDAAYVLTGTRTPPPANALTQQQTELIKYFAQLTKEQQLFILQTVAALAAANKEESK